MQLTPLSGPTLWARGAGAAKVEENSIVLNRHFGEAYWLADASGLAFDLAALPRPLTARRALRFVQKYGLIHHPQLPPYEWVLNGNGDRRPVTSGNGLSQSEPLKLTRNEAEENFADWEPIAQTFDNLLTLYASLPPTENQDSLNRAALELALHNCGEDIQTHSDEALCDLASRYLLGAVTTGLQNAEIHYVLRQDLPDPPRPNARAPVRQRSERRYFQDVKAASLDGYAYFQVLKLMCDETPIRRCSECSRYHVVTYKSMQFCSLNCGTTARVRRHRQQRADMVVRNQDGSVVPIQIK